MQLNEQVQATEPRTEGKAIRKNRGETRSKHNHIFALLKTLFKIFFPSLIQCQENTQSSTTALCFASDLWF